jgi:hypothetical protein
VKLTVTNVGARTDAVYRAAVWLAGVFHDHAGETFA